MPKHLKTHILNRLNSAISHFLAPSDVSALHSRGVRYFVPVEGIDAFWGAMNTVKEGRRYRKHIIVRHAPEHNGLLQLYTYHFPKHWSAACVENREMIKEEDWLSDEIKATAIEKLDNIKMYICYPDKVYDVKKDNKRGVL